MRVREATAFPRREGFVPANKLCGQPINCGLLPTCPIIPANATQCPACVNTRQRLLTGPSRTGRKGVQRPDTQGELCEALVDLSVCATCLPGKSARSDTQRASEGQHKKLGNDAFKLLSTFMCIVTAFCVLLDFIFYF